MFKRVVNAFELVGVLCVVAFVVGLFITPAATKHVPTGNAVGAQIFGQRCAACHGASGDGGAGPKLSDGVVVDHFPDEADQIAVVTDGRAGMPAFGSRLSADEIAAVVRYTREDLAK